LASLQAAVLVLLKTLAGDFEEEDYLFFLLILLSMIAKKEII
jgi:hypothetical protein